MLLLFYFLPEKGGKHFLLVVGIKCRCLWRTEPDVFNCAL